MEQTLKKGNGLAVAGFILSLLAFLAALLCLTDGLVIILTVLRWIFVLPGLGLSIAKNLTQLHGGDMNLEIDGDLFKVNVTFPVVE